MEDYTESLKAIEKSIDYVSSNLPETAHLYTDGIEAAISNGFAKLGPGIGGKWFDESLQSIDTTLKSFDEALAELNETLDNHAKWLHDINISLRLLAQMKVYELRHSNVRMPEATGTIMEPLDKNENSPYWADDD